MTDTFYALKKNELIEMRNSGTDAMTALRWLEVACGRAGEEFRDEGKALVEEVYDGRIDTSASRFTPNHPAPVRTRAIPSDEEMGDAFAAVAKLQDFSTETGGPDSVTTSDGPLTEE